MGAIFTFIHQMSYQCKSINKPGPCVLLVATIFVANKTYRFAIFCTGTVKNVVVNIDREILMRPINIDLKIQVSRQISATSLVFMTFTN